MIRILLGFVLGLVLGILGARWLFPQAAAPQVAAPAPLAEATDDFQADAPVLPSRVASPLPPAAERSQPVPAETREEVAPANELMTAALREFALAGIRQGWSSLRPDPIPGELLADGIHTYEEALESLPPSIGRELAERENAKEAALEDARTGGAVALLATLLEGESGPLPELAEDPEAFGALFPRMSSGPSIAADQHLATLAEEVEDGTTWSFPAGVYEIGDLLGRQQSFPRDVTLEGAGMSSTLLVLSTDLGARGVLRRFAIRDCTVFTNGNYLFDHRRGAATVVMDRVRVVGFDSGAGGSCALVFREGVALYARQCRFEAGYGRHPEHGNLFDVRHDALIARFENCTISGVYLSVQRLRPGTTVVFANCALTDILDDPESQAEGHRGIRFPGTSIHRFDHGEGKPPRLDLNQLFPDWKSRIVRK